MATVEQKLSPPNVSAPWANGHSTKAQEDPRMSIKGNIQSFDGCVSTGGPRRQAQRYRSAKNLTLLGTIRTWLLHNQISLSISIITLLALAYTLFPRARRRLEPVFSLSYYDDDTGLYNRGPKDMYFVLLWVVIFTGLRAAIMSYLLFPFAELCGIKKSKAKTRFAEQAWLFLYDGTFWTLGMYIMYHSDYFLNLREMWTNFPSAGLHGLFKWYYLVQFAFWIQQIVVVHIEERRKDHWQMFTHHIVTCLLISGSYAYYQNKVGNVILCAMDVVDLFLPIAKMLNYAGRRLACDIAFGVFIVSWFLARHVAYLMVCWSVYADVPHVMTKGCYDSHTGSLLDPVSPDMAPGGEDVFAKVYHAFINSGGPVCFNDRIRYAFLGLLLFLQGITIMWFFLILRVAWNVIQGSGADDVRSDDEDDAEEEEIAQPVVEAIPTMPMPPVEQVVGVESLNLKRKNSPVVRSRKPGASSSGAAIISGSDRKELLGRIGCDKPA